MTTSADGAIVSSGVTPRSGPCPLSGWAPSGRPSDASSRCAATLTVFSTLRGDWQPRSETAYYVCSRELSALDAHHAVRDHWAVENALHHVRDVAMAEDASRIRKAPGVFAQLRTCALNLLRQAGHDNIRAARQTTGWSEHALLHLCRQLQQ